MQRRNETTGPESSTSESVQAGVGPEETYMPLKQRVLTVVNRATSLAEESTRYLADRVRELPQEVEGLSPAIISTSRSAQREIVAFPDQLRYQIRRSPALALSAALATGFALAFALQFTLFKRR